MYTVHYIYESGGEFNFSTIIFLLKVRKKRNGASNFRKIVKTAMKTSIPGLQPIIFQGRGRFLSIRVL